MEATTESNVQTVANDIVSRATAIVDGGHTTQAIIENALHDIKALQKSIGMNDVLKFMATGKITINNLTSEQVKIIERLAVKSLAVLSKIKPL